MEENMIDEMMEYLSEVTEENAELRVKMKEMYDSVKQNNRKSFMKGMGAGIACTPAAFWLAWKLVDLLILAADWIDVAPVILATVAVCVIGGGTMFLHSDAVLKAVDTSMNVMLNDMGLFDDDDCGSCVGYERGK